MTATFQASLLDTGSEIGPGPLGATVRRRPLSDGAWIDLRPGWMSGADALFERLLSGVPWRAERRQMYERVVDVPRLLEPFRTAGLCLYRDGRDSVAWHGDTIGRGSTEDTMVAIVSVGTPRALLLRPRRGGHALALRAGPRRPARDGR